MMPFEKLMMMLGAAGLLVTAGFHVGRHGMTPASSFPAATHERVMDRAISLLPLKPDPSAGGLPNCANGQHLFSTARNGVVDYGCY